MTHYDGEQAFIDALKSEQVTRKAIFYCLNEAVHRWNGMAGKKAPREDCRPWEIFHGKKWLPVLEVGGKVRLNLDLTPVTSGLFIVGDGWLSSRIFLLYLPCLCLKKGTVKLWGE